MFELIAIGLHLGSQHYGGDAWQWNNVNPGIYAMAKVETPLGDKWVAGAYRNSQDHTTVYAGRVFSPTDWFDIVVGGATGYRSFPVIPAVVPSIHYGSFRVSFIPQIGSKDDNAAVVHFQLEYKF